MKEVRQSELERFVAAVISRLGYHVHQHNEEQIRQLLQRRLERTGCGGVEEYIARFSDARFADGELREIALELTVAETYFFRHPEQFQAFVEVALPERMKARRGERRLNVLSAGCATGEEAYSLAAAMQGVADLAGWQVGVWGVDVNPQLVQKARDASYSPWSLRAVTDQQRRQHFQPEGKRFLLEESLKANVHFECRNLLDDDVDFWRNDFFDIIFCRNVMIYFSPAAIRTVAERLARSLAPGGFLFLGPSETLRGVSQRFHLRHTHGAFYYQRRRPGEPPPQQPMAPTAADAQAAPQPDQFPGRPLWVSAIADSSDRVAAMADRARRGPQEPSAAAPPAPPLPAFANDQDLDEVRDLLRQERFDDALKAISALSEQAAADPDALLLQAVVLVNQGELPRAEQLCGQLLARDELRPGAHYLMAVCQERRGDHLSAAEHDQTSIYLDETFAMPHLHLGLLAKRLGDAATARRELGEALALLEREDASRILLFGGGFSREALTRFCQAQRDRCGDEAASKSERAGGRR